MRFLLTVTIVTLYVMTRLDAASNPNNLETDIDNTSLSFSENLNVSAARKEEAFELVVAIAKNFSAKYSNALAGSTYKSRACSPLSAFLSLSILSYGAQGSTKRKLLKGLGLSGHKPRTVQLGLRTLIDHLNNYNQVEMQVHNQIYFPTGLSPNPAFAELAKRFFRSSIQNVDLRYECSTTAKVNGWFVAGSNRSYIGPNPTIALANTFHLKGPWKTGFDVSKTGLRFFDVNGHDRIVKDSMYTFGRFRYGRIREIDSTFVELPYKSDGSEDGISAFIILSNHYEGYRPMMDRISKIDIKTLLNYTKKNVHVFFPKFKIQAEIRSNMWMPQFFGSDDPFKPTSNFSKILTSPELSFSESLDKIFIEFDEHGDACKASAGVFYKTRDARSTNKAPEIRFEVNRPFVVRIATTGKHNIDLVTISISGNTFSPRKMNRDETTQ